MAYDSIEIKPVGYNHYIGGTYNLAKSGTGTLKGVFINTPVPAGSISLFDNNGASGNAMAIITLGASTLPIPSYLPFNIPFNLGLGVGITGAVDVTVTFK